MAQDGPEGFSLRGVATRAGVTAPAVYRHFKNKDELLAAVGAECYERLGAAMDEAVAAEHGDSLARFRAVGIAYVQFAVAHPEHFRAMAIPGLIDKLPADARSNVNEWHSQQRADLLAGQAAGEIADVPIDELLLAANALVHGLAHLIVEGQLGEVDARRARELAIAVTGTIGVGFAPRDKPVSAAVRATRS